MTKNNNLKKLIIFTILITMIISIIPVNAVIYNETIHYETGYEEHSVTTSRGHSVDTNDNPFNLRFTNIQPWIGVYSLVYSFPYVGGNWPIWGVRDNDIVSDETPVTYYIGADIVSTGDMYFNVYRNSEGVLTSGILAFSFNTPIDTLLTGSQRVSCSYDKLNFNYLGFRVYGGSVITQTGDCPYPVIYVGAYEEIKEVATGVGYKNPLEFNLDFSYQYDTNIGFMEELNILRYGETSAISLANKNDQYFIKDTSSNDLYLEKVWYYPGTSDLPYILNVTNPIWLSGDNQFYDFTIPNDYEGSEEEEEDADYTTLIFNTYNTDSPTEKVPSDFELYILNETSSEYELNTYGYSTGIIYLNNRPNNRHYLMSQSATGYLDLDTYFDISGTTEKTVYMTPGSEYVTATITTYDGIDRDTRISSQSELFILNEITYQFDSIAEFENPGIFFHDTALTNREYKLTQNKTGYTPIETTYNIDTDTTIDNYMYQEGIPEFDDIVELTYSVFDNQYPSNMISAYYDLSLYNTTSESWVSIALGLNSDISILSMPNNHEYNLSLTKYGYTPKDNYFSMTGDRTLNFGMYPIVTEGTYVVTFKIRDFDTGDYISGAKITVNDTTKYTPYNGNTAFWDIEDYIIYEVSKPGYVTVTGNKIITENQAIFINLQTETSAYGTPIPTTIIPPDIMQPTNLLESIQYAFQKMFGLSSSSEDMEIANLLMGLGIIFAGACLIATITKDALGAVVGALIGFIMSLALGFIPLWILFVGFASFTIYIILTKTGGSE